MPDKQDCLDICLICGVIFGLVRIELTNYVCLRIELMFRSMFRHFFLFVSSFRRCQIVSFPLFRHTRQFLPALVVREINVIVQKHKTHRVYTFQMSNCTFADSKSRSPSIQGEYSNETRSHLRSALSRLKAREEVFFVAGR